MSEQKDEKQPEQPEQFGDPVEPWKPDDDPIGPHQRPTEEPKD